MKNKLLKITLICLLCFLPGINYTNSYMLDQEKATGNSITTAFDYAAPVSTFSSPFPNQNIPGGAPIMVSGTSRDDSGVSSVDLFYTSYIAGNCDSANYILLTGFPNPLNNSPFNWIYNWTPAPGSYCLKAEAVDTLGNREQSPVVENVIYLEVSPTTTPTPGAETTPTPTPTLSPAIDLTPTPTETVNLPIVNLELSPTPTPTEILPNLNEILSGETTPSPTQAPTEPAPTETVDNTSTDQQTGQTTE